MKTSVRPSRLAFFERGPLCFGPLRDGVFIAFTSPLRRLLGTPSQAPQEVLDKSQQPSPVTEMFAIAGHAEAELSGHSLLSKAFGAPFQR